MQWAIGRRMGVDLQQQDTPTRVVVNVVAIMIGVILKLLVDKALVTNADLTAAFGAARDSEAYGYEPVQPAPVDTNPPL